MISPKPDVKLEDAALQLLLDLVLGIAGGLLRGVGTRVKLAYNPLPGCLQCLAKLGKRRAGRAACAKAEVSGVLAGERSQLVYG